MTDLTDDERRALDELLPPARRTGDLVADLTDAAREALRRREQNSRDGGAVIGALHRELRSWRQLERTTGIPVKTARRWSAPPPTTGDRQDGPVAQDHE